MPKGLQEDSPTAGNRAASLAQQGSAAPPPPTAGENPRANGPPEPGVAALDLTAAAAPRRFPECALVLVDHLVAARPAARPAAAGTREKDGPAPPPSPSARAVLETAFCVGPAGAAGSPAWVEAAIAAGDVCYVCQKPFGDVDRADMVRANCACRHPLHCSCMSRQIIAGMEARLNNGGDDPDYTWRCGQCQTPFYGQRLHDAVCSLESARQVFDEEQDDSAAQRRKTEGHEDAVYTMLLTWRSTSPCIKLLGDNLQSLGYCYMQLAERRRRESAHAAIDDEEEKLVLLGRCALAWCHFARGKDVRTGCVGVESVFNSCGRPTGQHLDGSIMHIEVQHLCNVLRYAKLPQQRASLQNAQIFSARLFLFDSSRFAPPIAAESPLWGEMEKVLVGFVADPETDLDRLVDVSPAHAIAKSGHGSHQPGRFGDVRPCALLMKAFSAAGAYGPSVWRPLLDKLRAHPVSEGTWVHDIMAVR
jgi:hypothetical protein